MFCKNCGQQMDDNATFCPACGANQTQDMPPVNNQRPVAPQANDAPSGGFAFLCFLFPIVGLILYLVWKDSMPMRARSCGKGAIIGVIVSVVVSILWGVIVALVVGNNVVYY